MPHKMTELFVWKPRNSIVKTTAGEIPWYEYLETERQRIIRNPKRTAKVVATTTPNGRQVMNLMVNDVSVNHYKRTLGIRGKDRRYKDAVL